MRRVWGIRVWGTAVALAGIWGLVGAGLGQATPVRQLPVPYNFPAGILSQVNDPAGSPAGTDDWSCRPSAAHPDPVVLVHGGFASPHVEWATIGPALHNAGYCVYAATWGGDSLPAPMTNFGGYQSVKTVGVPRLSAFVARVLRSTGARSVSLVSHSFGSLLDAYYVRYAGGAATVRTVVSIAGIYQGVGVPPWMAASNPFTRGCAVCTEPVAGSQLVRAINAGGSPYVAGVRYTNIATRYDETAVPYTSGLVPGRAGQYVRNIVVQNGCEQDYSNHQAVVATRRTVAYLRNALDPGHPVAVPCQAVVPSYGAVSQD